MRSLTICQFVGKRLVAIALLSLNLSASAAEVIPPMHVRLAPEVRQRIKGTPAPEQARVKKAMSVANRFVTMRFAGRCWSNSKRANDNWSVAA